MTPEGEDVRTPQGPRGPRRTCRCWDPPAARSWLGATLVLEAGALRPATVAVFVLGWSITSWNGAPLPLALDPLGDR
jgi:hypothetical protein